MEALPFRQERISYRGFAISYLLAFLSEARRYSLHEIHKPTNMQHSQPASLLNRIAIALLLVASAAYHVHQGLEAKTNDSLFRRGLEFSGAAWQNNFLPSSGFPLVILPKQHLNNHKPIYLCVK